VTPPLAVGGVTPPLADGDDVGVAPDVVEAVVVSAVTPVPALRSRTPDTSDASTKAAKSRCHGRISTR
jgi:hypothetical protein